MLRSFVDIAVLPPAGPLWLSLLGAGLLAAARRHAGFRRGEARRAGARRAGACLLGIGLASLFLLSTQLSQGWLLATVDHYPPLETDGHDWPQAESIVVLGAGVQWGSREWGGDAPSSMAVARLRYAAEIWRQTQLPVLVTGYTGDGMKVVMERDFGVPVRWLEDRSYDTWENAVNTARLLRDEGVGKVFVVTHFWHMPRAMLAFRETGLEAVAAPMGFLGPRPDESLLDRLRPRPGPLLTANLVVHEWIGLAWYRLRHL
ncbi:MAG: YdcF family protein [Holophagales bacterium]|nr:YdcF family protein [Holophagales bacterium]